MSRIVFESDMWHDQHATYDLAPALRLSALSVRSHAAHYQNARSQDAIAVIGDGARRRLAFCVCDGVGSSFAGYIAARYLARRLTSYLFTSAILEPPSPGLVETMLRQWVVAASTAVTEVALPSEMNPLVRDVLDEMRAERGSETVFLAGLARWDTSDAGDLRVYAMGNVSGVISSAHGGAVADSAINEQGSDSDRWTTRRGPVGALFAARYPFTGRLRVASDGLDALGSDAWLAPAERLMSRAAELRATTDTDDLAVLDIWPNLADNTMDNMLFAQET